MAQVKAQTIRGLEPEVQRMLAQVSNPTPKPISGVLGIL